jgi:phospholipid transport system substrate-binding protein
MMHARLWGWALAMAAALVSSPAPAREALPLLDVSRMTESVLARHWPLASPEQQKRLTAEFAALVARTANSHGVTYDMERTPAGWKVYDLKLHGMSLVATYRDAFGGVVRERGVNGLISLLAEENRQRAAAAPGQPLLALAMLYTALHGRK